MEDLAPEIVRQRLVIEGYYTTTFSAEELKEFMAGLAEMLGMTIIYGPNVMDIARQHDPKQAGYEAVMVWAESGSQIYVWEVYKFFTVDIYTCKAFEPQVAIDAVIKFFGAEKFTSKEV